MLPHVSPSRLRTHHAIFLIVLQQDQHRDGYLQLRRPRRCDDLGRNAEASRCLLADCTDPGSALMTLRSSCARPGVRRRSMSAARVVASGSGGPSSHSLRLMGSRLHTSVGCFRRPGGIGSPLRRWKVGAIPRRRVTSSVGGRSPARRKAIHVRLFQRLTGVSPLSTTCRVPASLSLIVSVH